MKQIMSIYVFAIISIMPIAANADVRCTTDTFGITKCVGYNKNGDWVNTKSRTNSLGITINTGHIGDRQINSRARATMSGNTPAYPATRRAIPMRRN